MATPFPLAPTDTAAAPSDVGLRLAALQSRLDAIAAAWPLGSEGGLAGFFVEALPRLFDSERATVFVAEPGADRIWSMVGTGIREREIEAPRGDSVVGRTVASGRWTIENAPEAARGFHHTADASTGFVTRGLVCVPIRSVGGREVIGAIEVLNRRGGAPYTEADALLLQQVADHLATSIEAVVVRQELRAVSRGLDQEVARLRSLYLGDVPLVAESPAMLRVLEMVKTLARTPVNVLVQGENGTGKEVVARLLHDLSERRDRPFVAVNCATIPEALMESEFFGSERGAFTGAIASRSGRFEDVAGGTLFLDEVADLPLSVQPKFLRAIQEGEGSRLGSSQVRHYDFRVVSASNRDLRAAVARGAFREDLYYRLFAVEVLIPPLRERPEDVPALAQAFLRDTCRRFGKRVAGLAPEVLELFEGSAWPGNVRQLKREVERLVALTPPDAVVGLGACSEDLLRAPTRSTRPGGAPLDLPERTRALETELIRRALAQTGGRPGAAAVLLGITRQGLHKKLRRLRLQPDRESPRAAAHGSRA